MEHSYYVSDLTLLNFASNEAAYALIKSTEGNLIVGEFSKETVEASRDIESPLPVPTDSTAEIELNWLVLLQDNVTKSRFVIRIACPDTTTAALRVANSDFADFTHVNWTAYKDAVEAIAVSVDGNPVTVLAAKIVGKDDLKTPNAFKGFI